MVFLVWSFSEFVISHVDLPVHSGSPLLVRCARWCLSARQGLTSPADATLVPRQGRREQVARAERTEVGGVCVQSKVRDE